MKVVCVDDLAGLAVSGAGGSDADGADIVHSEARIRDELFAKSGDIGGDIVSASFA